MALRHLIVAALLASTAVTLLLAAHAIRRFNAAGSRAYVGLMAAISIYSLGYALELSGSTLEWIVFALRIEYLGLPFIPAFWIVMALQYAGLAKHLPRWVYVAVFAFPLVIVVLHYTTAQHGLFYSRLDVSHAGPFPLALIEKGPWYHANVVYTNLCVLAGNMAFLHLMLRPAGPYRKQAATAFLGSLIPWSGHFIYQLGLSPYGIDIVPFTFTITGPVFAVALFRFRMFDLAPIARDMVFDVMLDPVLVIDTQGRLVDFNKAMVRVIPGLGGRNVGEPIAGVLASCPGLAEGLGEAGGGAREVRMQAEGEALVFQARVIPIELRRREEAGRLVMFHDITRQKQLLDQLRELASMDGMTGCYNHRHFLNLFQEELNRSRRYAHPLSFILLDLDHFKRVNDAFGHPAGDEVLRAVAAVLRNGLRGCDILGRYGGEEFAVALPETGLDAATAIADRLRRDLEASAVRYEDVSIAVTGSFGVVEAGRGVEPTLESVIKAADAALYRAKAAGRNRVER